MISSPYYLDAIPYSLTGTSFATVFNAVDGRATDTDWFEVVNKLISDGAKPVFNQNVPDVVCARAWIDLSQKLGVPTNILFVKIALAAGVTTKEDILAIFASHGEWVDQAGFRGALGDYLGIHNTQVLPLSIVVAREEGTLKLIDTFSKLDTAVAFLQEKGLIRN